MSKKIVAILLLFSILLAACGGEETPRDLPPVSITSPEAAIAYVSKTLGIPKASLISPFIEGWTDEELAMAVTDAGGRINGFVVYPVVDVADEDVWFFIVTRDVRIFYNLDGEEVRDGVPLIYRYQSDSLELYEFPDQEEPPKGGNGEEKPPPSSGGTRDFTTEDGVRAFFEARYPHAYSISIKYAPRGRLEDDMTLTFISGFLVQVRIVNDATLYFAANDGRLFDANNNIANLRPIN